MAENTDLGTITRTIAFPTSVMDDVKIENVITNRGKDKDKRQTTEQEIIDLVRLGISARKAERERKK